LKDYNIITKVLSENGIINNYQIEDSFLLLFTDDIKNTLQHINNHYSKGKDNLVYIDISKPSLDMVFEALNGDNEK